MAKRLAGRFGYPKDDPFRVTFHPDRLDEYLKWWRKAKRIFVCSMGDLFHKNVNLSWLDNIFHIIKLCPQHTFIILTKRPENIELMLYDSNILEGGDYLPNVHLGVSVENQHWATERISTLFDIPAAKRIINIEPMLESIDLSKIFRWNDINGVMLGGESGPGARVIHADWVRLVKDQCVEAGIPFFFKQWGEWTPIVTLNIETMVKVGKKQAGRLLDGREWSELP
jgi:protein gp37